VESERRALDALAEAVLEGHRVDWASEESSAGATNRDAVRELKVLAGIADLHRKLTSDISDSARLQAAEDRLERWGRLKLLERIGRGSFGDVYRAWDSKLDREVALKLLRAGGAEPQGAAVLREARLLARVRHPNVVTVYDADEIDGRVGLWMEFVSGQNLEQVLSQRKRFEDRDVTRVGIELCRALLAVHEAGLLHRDIKTQNLMQAGDGRVVLMDFGTGWELQKEPSASEDAAGTPLYLAPEIFRGAPATVQSEIYSAGVLLFHLLTGAYPVRGTNVREVVEAHARRQQVVLSGIGSGVSRVLADAIARAIQPDPARRFPSVREMLASLELAQRSAEVRKRRRKRLAFGAASLAALAAAFVPGVRRRIEGLDGRSPAGSGIYFGSTPEKRAVQTPLAMLLGTPSPDGRFLPYSDFEAGNLALYEFATGVSRTLTKRGDGGHENFADLSIVSADGSRIAYGWEDGSCDCTQLRVIDTTGENERVLYGGRDTPEITPVAWSADGGRILGTRKGRSGEWDIVLVSVADGEVRLVRSVAHGRPKVTLSHDGRYVAYDRPEALPAVDNGVYISSTAGGEENPVVTGPTNDSDPMWTPDGSGLIFSSTRTGGSGLWLQRVKDGRPTGKPQLLDKEMSPSAPITLTRDGALFYSHKTGFMDVYVAPIDPATGEVTAEPTNIASHVQGSNIYADWSPDGETLAFASWRTPSRNILVFHSLKTGSERELQLDLVANGVHWSPDGRSIAIGGRLVDPESGSVAQAVLGAHHSFAWDLDGRHAYLTRLGNPEGVFRADLQTGEEERLYQPPPDSVMGDLSLSPDGRSVAFSIYLRPEKTFRLMAVPTGGGAARKILEVPGTRGSPGVGGWTRDGRRIFFTLTTAESPKHEHYGELCVVPFEGGPPRRLGLKMRALRDVRVSPDGSRISFTSGYPESDLWVFENFLPRRAAE
jgi:serine/threonine protein kinase/Tol biopolymer transport system component